MSGPENPKNPQGFMDRYEITLRLEIAKLETELEGLDQQLSEEQKGIEAGTANKH